MKNFSFLTKTRFPYAIVTLLVIFSFLFCLPSYDTESYKKLASIFLFIVLFLIGLTRHYHYRRILLASNEEKIKDYIRQGMYIERHNRGLRGAIETSKELFDIASNEILIQAGDLDHEFYENEVIYNSLKRFLENGHKIRIICSPKERCKSRTIFDFLKNPNYDIKILHAQERPDLHFMVIDDKHYRIEKKHPTEVHSDANILYNNCFAADFHKYLFMKSWKALKNDENF